MEVSMEFYLEVLKNQIWMEGFLCGVMAMAFFVLVGMCVFYYYQKR